MDAVAILGLVALVLAKEAGVPLPIPGDLIIIGAGATLAGDIPTAAFVLAVILVAGFIGASVQFFLFGSALRRPLLAALERLGIGEARLTGLAERFRTTGTRGVAPLNATHAIVETSVTPAIQPAANSAPLRPPWLPERMSTMPMIGSGLSATASAAGNPTPIAWISTGETRWAAKAGRSSMVPGLPGRRPEEQGPPLLEERSRRIRRGEVLGERRLRA